MVVIIVLGLITVGIVLWTNVYRTPGGNKWETGLKTLVRQAARWTTAAKQDSNSLVATLHANYGAGYLWALGDIATPQEILDVTGVDYMRLKTEITGVQDSVASKLSKECPGYAPTKEWLSAVAGER